MFDLAPQIWTDFAGVNERKPIANQIWLSHATFRDILSDKFDDKFKPTVAFLQVAIKAVLNLSPQKRVLKFINLKTVHSFGIR